MSVNLRCAGLIALVTLTIAGGRVEKSFAEADSGAPLQIAIDSSPAGLDPHNSLTHFILSVCHNNGKIHAKH